MDTKQNISPEGTEEKSSLGRPSVPIVLLIAGISVFCAAFLPELGLLGLIALTTAAMFTASSKAPVPVMLIPFAGVVGAYFYGGPYQAGLSGALILASFFAGLVLTKHGFHRSLMTFIFVLYAAAVGAIALYTKIYDISAKVLVDAFENFVGSAMETAVSSASDKLSAENAKLLAEQYDMILQTLVYYSPAILAWIIQVCGIAATRFTGLVHNFTGSRVYPQSKRPAVLDRVYAVIFAASFLLGTLGTGVFGLCAENVMLIFMVPAACAGVSSYRVMLLTRRLSGKRGFPISLLILIFVFVFMSPVMGLVILAITGTIDAFKKRSQKK